jgi:D-3-phosphoglycerate dehydrogenase
VSAESAAPDAGGRLKVLVAEKIGDSGVDLLREHFDVDLGVDWSVEELSERIGAYHGIVIRSATKLNEDLLSRAENLRAIGRAGVGVDNVDVPAATKRGIVVANAPQSNVVTAAEHTMALLLALARNVPQAHMSLTSGKWERSKFSGVELFEKTLGILGFGFSRSTRSSAPSATASSVSRRRRTARRSTRRRISSPSTCRRHPTRKDG